MESGRRASTESGLSGSGTPAVSTSVQAPDRYAKTCTRIPSLRRRPTDTGPVSDVVTGGATGSGKRMGWGLEAGDSSVVDESARATAELSGEPAAGCDSRWDVSHAAIANHTQGIHDLKTIE